MNENVIKAALLGFGTVGTGVYKVLKNQEKEMSAKIGCKVEIKKILVRNIEKAAAKIEDASLLTSQWDEIINDPEIEEDIRKVFEGFGASIVPYPVTERWLSYIREKGMKMYYLSNYSDEMYCQSEEQLSFLKTFDGGVFSWKEKCMKPDPKIYEILLKRYKIVPEQALFFDDRPENVEGARKVGINGVVFNTDIPLQMLEK